MPWAAFAPNVFFRRGADQEHRRPGRHSHQMCFFAGERVAASRSGAGCFLHHLSHKSQEPGRAAVALLVAAPAVLALGGLLILWPAPAFSWARSGALGREICGSGSVLMERDGCGLLAVGITAAKGNEIPQRYTGRVPAPMFPLWGNSILASNALWAP